MSLSAMPLVERTDEQLIAAHRGGEPGAFEVVFRRYRGRAMAYARRMLGRPEEAEEVTTEAFVKVLEGRWKPTGTFRPVLFTVVHRTCLERLRKRKTAARFHHKAGSMDVSPGLDEQIDAQARKARVIHALDTIPHQHRSVLLLYYGQELPSKEVATILGCTDQQVRSQLSYARRLLRGVLEEVG